MRCDPPRDNLPSQMRCGDPLSMGNVLRMADESEPLVPRVEPSIPPDHFEPSGSMAKLSRALANNTVLLDKAAEWMEKAKRYKALWVREMMRRSDFPRLKREGEAYGLLELDHARAEVDFWVTESDSAGNIEARRES